MLRSPRAGCGGSPATHGTPSSRPAVRRVVPARRSRPGYAPMATGSDIGGSIRIPASFCGVVGYKAPFGRVPAMPPFNLDQYCHDGPMARTVADAALLTNLDRRPPPARRRLAPGPAAPRRSSWTSIAGMRVALCVRLGDYPIEPVVEANTRQAADVSRGSRGDRRRGRTAMDDGADLHAPPGHISVASSGRMSLPSWNTTATCSPTTPRHSPRRPISRGFVDGLRIEGELYRPLGELLEEFDALMCPTMGTTGFPVGERVHRHRMRRRRRGAAALPPGGADPAVQHRSAVARCWRCHPASPTTACRPAYRSSGRTYDDPTVFRIALAYEAAVGGFARAPIPVDPKALKP